MGRIWLTALALCVAALVTLEFTWRALGFEPSITDDEDLWAYHREAVTDFDHNLLVLLGRSRIKQEFVPEVFEAMCPHYRYVQLAIEMWHPIATLRDLAENTGFAGVVVCSVTAESLLPELWDQQKDSLDYYYTRWGPMKRMNRIVRTWLQGHLVILLPELILQRVGPDLLKGDVEPQFLRTRADRTQVVDYHKVNIEEFTRARVQGIQGIMKGYTELEGYARWPKDLDVIEAMVEQIQGRGGKVVFLRCPTSGEYLATEARAFPRDRFWDVFAKHTAATTIHFQDIAGMKELVCAEGTHLHREDATAFTRILTEELLRRGILSKGQAAALRGEGS